MCVKLTPAGKQRCLWRGTQCMVSTWHWQHTDTWCTQSYRTWKTQTHSEQTNNQQIRRGNHNSDTSTEDQSGIKAQTKNTYLQRGPRVGRHPAVVFPWDDPTGQWWPCHGPHTWENKHVTRAVAWRQTALSQRTRQSFVGQFIQDLNQDKVWNRSCAVVADGHWEITAEIKINGNSYCNDKRSEYCLIDGLPRSVSFSCTASWSNTLTNSYKSKSMPAHLSYERAQVAAPPPSLSETCGTRPAHKWEESGWTVVPQSMLPTGKHGRNKVRPTVRTVVYISDSPHKQVRVIIQSTWYVCHYCRAPGLKSQLLWVFICIFCPVRKSVSPLFPLDSSGMFPSTWPCLDLSHESLLGLFL